MCIRDSYEPIADQMTKSGINYFVGGGEQYFNSRKDKRNIINEMTENGYEFVYNISDYEKNKSNYIGFFTAKDEPYYSYKGVNYSSSFLVAAITFLSKSLGIFS